MASFKSRLLISLLLLVKLIFCTDTNERFLLTAPKMLPANSTAKVCLTLFNIESSGKIKIELLPNPSGIIDEEEFQETYEYDITEGRSSCFDMKIPESLSGNGKLRVSGSFSSNEDKIYTFTETANVTFEQELPTIIFETDRPLYRTGNTVKFRILSIQSDFKPHSDLTTTTIIEDQTGMEKSRWINPEADNGIISIEYPLKSSDLTGNWLIRFQSSFTRKFMKFEVDDHEPYTVLIIPPKRIWSTDTSAEWKICAYNPRSETFIGSVYTLFQFIPIANPNANANEYASHYDKINGCLTIRKYMPVNSGYAIRIKAFLLNEDTEITAEMTSPVISSKLVLDFPSFYKSGIPLRGKLLAKSSNYNYPNENIEICLRFKVRSSVEEKMLCRQFITDDSGTADIELPAPTEDISSINVTASTLTENPDMESISLFQHYLHPNASELKIIEPSSACEDSISIRVQYTDISRPHTFYYQVFSQGRIIVSDFFKDNNPNTDEVENLKNTVNDDLPKYFIIGFTNINIPLPQPLPLYSKLSVFYIDEERRIISDTIELYQQECLKNKIEVHFNEAKIFPGQNATLKIQTKPQSVCAISAVDENIHNLKIKNGISFQKVVQLLKKPNVENGVSSTNILGCKEDLYRKWMKKPIEDKPTIKDARMIVLTDALLSNRTCKNNPVLTTNSNDPPDENDETYFRHIFSPESWLWEVQNSGNEGYIEISREVPHRLTNWVAEVFCMSSEQGLEFSSPVILEVVQPFSTNILIPNFVKQGETFPVIVSVSDFTNECMAVEVQVVAEFRSPFGNKSFDEVQCLCSQESKNFTFQFQAEVSGKVNISISVRTLSNNDACQDRGKPMSDISEAKSILKVVHVEMEGYQKEVRNTKYICLSNFEEGNVNEEIHFSVPSGKMIPDSFQSEVLLSGDIVKPLLQDLKQFIQIPWGNGEENMISFSINLAALLYVTPIRRLGDNIEFQLYHSMKIAMERQLNYAHGKDFFSINGDEDKEGNLWLNAFILKCLSHTMSFLLPSRSYLIGVGNWIKKQQLENGCFPNRRDLGNKKLSGFGSDSTAYVLVSLLEAGLDINDEVVINAFKCLKENESSNLYTMALTAYAASLAKLGDLADELLEKVEELVNIEESDLTEQLNAATQMEIRGYAILAMLERNSEQHEERIIRMIQSIVKYLNDYGGFLSLQGTVIGLQALSAYSQSAKREEIKLDFLIKDIYDTEEYHLDKNNRFHPNGKTYSTKTERPLQIQGQGVGCAVVQDKIIYNSPDNTKSDSFDLEIKTKSEGAASASCETISVHICTRYKHAGEESNLVIVDIQMISGFEPCEFCLKKLLSREKLQLGRLEIKKNHLILYFKKLTNKQKCFSFNIREIYKIKDRKASVVKVYDYFAPRLFSAVSYSIPSSCIEEPLPDISPDLLFDLESMIIPGLTDETCETCNSETEIKAEIPDRDYNIPVDEIIPDPVYIKPLGSAIKKSLPNNLANFHDRDWDMEIPGGLEGPEEVFVAPPDDFAKTASCPKCYSNLPENFKELYCQSDKVYSAIIEDNKEQRMKLLFDISSQNINNPRFINEEIHYILNTKCNCPIPEDNSEILLMGPNEAIEFKSLMKLNSHLILFKVNNSLFSDILKTDCKLIHTID